MQNENEHISPIAKAVIDEDLPTLEAALKNGWNINKPLIFGKHDTDPPVIYALFTKKLKVARWLIEHKANLNIKNNPAIVMAVYGGKTMCELVLQHGADVNSTDHLSRNAVTIALYQKNIDLIPYLVENDFDPKKDGRSLRQAVFGRQTKAVKMLLDLDFDVNFRLRDQVHPQNPSAVHVAAQNKNDLKTVQLLVEHGADIRLKDEYGDRPFTAAHLNNDAQLMAYLKALEPPEWHDETLHLANLAQYNLPQSMIELCKQSSNNKRKISFDSTSQYGPNWIVLHPVLLLKTAKFCKKEFVEIVGDTDNYDNFLVWYPAKNCLAYMDYEHEEFKVLGKWEDFLADPTAFFAKYLSQYFQA